MSGLVYGFMAVCAAALGVVGYFVLTFSVIEAGLFALIALLAGLWFLERRLRHRAESRIERAIDELSRLLSTDAKAGQTLSKRLNDIEDLELGPRMEVIEADMSVIGTVVRQVAEAVSELETSQGPSTVVTQAEDDRDETPRRTQGPLIPLDSVRRALDDERLVHHMQPIATLPQRKTHAYEMIPRLVMDRGELVDPPDFMPVRTADGDVVIRRIERISLDEAVAVVRRARTFGSPVRMIFTISPATLSDRTTVDQMVDILADNRAVAPDLVLALTESDWRALSRAETEMLAVLTKQGIGLSIRDATTLRLDFGDLAMRGVRYVSMDAATFLDNPARLTDFHSADIADYAQRFGVRLVASHVASEEQILSLLDDAVALAQGPAVAAPAPINHHLRAEASEDQLESVAARH